jgi:hypothetical protein
VSFLGSAGKYGIGLGFLANTFFSSNGGGLTVENLKELAENVGFDADFLDNGIIKGFIDGKEGPLSLLGTSLFLLSGDIQKWGIMGALAWMGVQLFQQYKKGELQSVFSTATGEPEAPEPAAPTIASANTYSREKLRAAIKELSVNSVAQVGDQNQDITNGEATLADSPVVPDGPDQQPD